MQLAVLNVVYLRIVCLVRPHVCRKGSSALQQQIVSAQCDRSSRGGEECAVSARVCANVLLALVLLFPPLILMCLSWHRREQIPLLLTRPAALQDSESPRLSLHSQQHTPQRTNELLWIGRCSCSIIVGRTTTGSTG